MIIEGVAAGEGQEAVIKEARAVGRPGDAAGVGILDLLDWLTVRGDDLPGEQVAGGVGGGMSLPHGRWGLLSHASSPFSRSNGAAGEAADQLRYNGRV
jgi:hypothetical protein